jgi:hypothetical protein
MDIKTIENIVQNHPGDLPDIDTLKVQKAINSLNNKKAPDADGIIAEHFTYGANAQIINVIFNNRKIPERLKKGILTPIWKKG